jgi:hypothetical protein
MENYEDIRKMRERMEAEYNYQRSQKIKSNFIEKESTRMKTCFIFAIAEFEKLFGHLWDESKEDAEIEGPEFYKKLFLELRKNVLDNGNNQIRAFHKDMENYNVDLVKYYYRFE